MDGGSAAADAALDVEHAAGRRQQRATSIVDAATISSVPPPVASRRPRLTMVLQPVSIVRLSAEALLALMTPDVSLTKCSQSLPMPMLPAPLMEASLCSAAPGAAAVILAAWPCIVMPRNRSRHRSADHKIGADVATARRIRSNRWCRSGRAPQGRWCRSARASHRHPHVRSRRWKWHGWSRRRIRSRCRLTDLDHAAVARRRIVGQEHAALDRHAFQLDDGAAAVGRDRAADIADVVVDLRMPPLVASRCRHC